jgi:hypothetical protein
MPARSTILWVLLLLLGTLLLGVALGWLMTF